MGIDEAREHNLSGAVDLHDLLAILQHPGIAQGVFGRARRNNLSSDAQHRAVTDEAKLLKFRAAARAGLRGGGAKSEQLANAG